MKFHCKFRSHVIIICFLAIILSECTEFKAESSLQAEAVVRPTNSYLSFMKTKKEKISKEFENFKFKSNLKNKQSSDSYRTLKYPDPTTALSENWMFISSEEFHNTARFPPVYTANGNATFIMTDSSDYRLNRANCSIPYQNPRPFEDKRFFYFSLAQCKVVYTATPTDVNVLGMFNLETEILDFSKTEDYSSEVLMYCLVLTDKDTKIWKLCNNSEDQIKAWMCMTASCKKTVQSYDFCYNMGDGVITQQNFIKQPIVLIPLPSPTCNQKWNYSLNGDDWDCVCSNGNEQSPINLPDKRKAIDADVRPSFNYDLITPTTTPTIDGSGQETLQIRNSGRYIHLLHDNMGRLITQDGTIYQAQEIMFHTPANHKIDGKAFDLEVVIIHTGITKGDISKQVTLSFLFEASPGIYNKFFEDLDIFNLPNPYTKAQDITKSLYIPKLMYDSFDDKVEFKPFSFYTYQGSLMVPPCTEQTIVYVASTPLKISTTTLFLLKEALKKPDLMNKSGQVIISQSSGVSNRKIQNINGRPIFHYEACDTNDKDIYRDGHYEKIKDKSTLYFYVNGDKPSGVPGAFVVTKDEAQGNLDKTLN